MFVWQKVLFAVVVVLGAVEGTCDIDQPDVRRGYRLVARKMEPCFKGVITEEMASKIKAAKNLEAYKSFFKDFCPHAQEVITCMAGVRESLVPCENKNVSMPFIIVSEFTEHLLVSGCENEGDRLAHLMRGMVLLMEHEDTLVPLRRCLHKAVAFMKLTNDADIDFISESYIIYHEFAKMKKCMKHVEDDSYKQVGQWMLDEVASKMKCPHPEDDTTVLCSELDVSKVPVTDFCQLKPLKTDHLFDQLEHMAVQECYSPVFGIDKLGHTNYTDMGWLKNEYKKICHNQRVLPKCLLEVSAYGESCLSQEEDKQFQLEVHALEEAMQRSCVKDGIHLAEVMHEIYKNTPEHGHAIRDCYESVSEASKAHAGHAVSTKNMRFYHDTAAFKQCLVEKLHATNDLARRIETVLSDVLRKMKCINPEDGTAVLCETIHEH